MGTCSISSAGGFPLGARFDELERPGLGNGSSRTQKLFFDHGRRQRVWRTSGTGGVRFWPCAPYEKETLLHIYTKTTPVISPLVRRRGWLRTQPQSFRCGGSSARVR